MNETARPEGSQAHDSMNWEPVVLHDVRSVIAALTSTKVATEVATTVGFGLRRTLYCLNAACTLGWVTREDVQLELPLDVLGAAKSDSARYTLSETGRRFLETAASSADEKLELGKALMASEGLRRLGGAFMTEDVDRSELARRIQSTTHLAENAARRRARMLLAWKALALSEAPRPRDTGASPSPVEPTIELSVQLNAYLASQLSQARLELLIGPGLSRRMRTKKGTPPPSKPELATALWSLCFPRTTVDPTADVDELLQVAVQRNPKALATLMKESFGLDPDTIDAAIQLLFTLPLQRIYTLAIDDLELAIDSRYALPRKVSPITADTPQIASVEKLQVIHLHGTAAEGSARFSPVFDKSAAPPLTKLAERFDAEYLAYPFLVLATNEDIDDIWKVLERRGRKGGRGSRELRPKSILVCPHLSPVRIALAKDNNVEYVSGDPIEFIERFIRSLKLEITAGHDVLRSMASSSVDDLANIEAVSETLVREKVRRTEYLMGQEPTWDDIRSGRAITRESDQKILKTATGLLSKRQLSTERTAASILALIGTAGTGKSTALMRLAIELSANGHKTGWIGASTELSSRSIQAFRRAASRFSVLLIDEIDRYGGRAAENLALLADAPGMELVVASLHSARANLLEDSSLASFHHSTITMPPLADTDIDLLIAALDADHRLGVLKGKTRAYQEAVFKEQAGRSLLVAMIQATSGRRFEEKVFDEWKDLPTRARYYYTIVTIASSLGYSLPRDELLRAGEASRTPEDLASIDLLASGNIIAKIGRDVFKSRHRLIADTLMKDLVKLDNDDLESCFRDLAFSVTHLLGPDSRETPRGRFVKRLLSYKDLHRALTLEGARSIYEVIEDNMHWDYHYWLQRGSLEVAEGDVGRAEQYLTYAMGMNPNDNLVITEFAYMRMKLAVSDPKTAEAAAILSEGAQMLRGQIANRGHRDYYPYHVLGSQALSWVTRCSWDRDEKLAFLRGVYRDLDEGAKRHPKQLDNLARGIQQRILALTSGLAS